MLWYLYQRQMMQVLQPCFPMWPEVVRKLLILSMSCHSLCRNCLIFKMTSATNYPDFFILKLQHRLKKNRTHAVSIALVCCLQNLTDVGYLCGRSLGSPSLSGGRTSPATASTKWADLARHS